MAWKIGRGIQFPGGDAAQLLQLSADRVTVQTTVTSTAATELPAGSRIVTIRADEPCWIRFGGVGVGAAAAGDDSMLFPAGVETAMVPLDTQNPPVPFTHFRALRSGSADGNLQIELVAHAPA